MAGFSSHRDSGLSLRHQLGTGTDIGGGRENQDESFVWTNKVLNIIVLGVLDGHGREVGRIAAHAGKQSIVSLLERESAYLITNPAEFLIRAHEVAHESIREAFQSELERQGFQIKRTEEGYLVKRRSTSDYWSCVHGGTSCTLVAVVENSLYIANVGDSTALMCASRPILCENHVQLVIDAAAADHCPRDPASSTGLPQVGHKVLVLTGEHSPESKEEFIRLRNFRSSEVDSSQPALLVVYDSPSHDKSQCEPVFNPSVSDFLQPSQRGSYYKNVRKEWASLVSTPPTAKFQDALAFTRSLGDLHLHTYGVTHLPEIRTVKLMDVFDALQAQHHLEGDGGSADVLSTIGLSTISIVVATDGVWDNWLYEDVGRFMMDASCLNAVSLSSEGAQKVMTSFMIRNAQFSKKNFGNQADNATGIVLYLSSSHTLPES